MKFILFALLLHSAIASATCIPGTKVLYQSHPERPAIGKEKISYSVGATNFSLKHRPDFQNTQVYVVGRHPDYNLGVASADDLDWCYDTETNSIRFTKAQPKMWSLGVDQGSIREGTELWIGYYSSEQKNEECLLGQFLEDIPGSNGNPVIGQESFLFQNMPQTHQLKHTPKSSSGVTLRATISANVINIFGEDWCYRKKTNSIEFLHWPPRIYDLGALPGGELESVETVWFAYEPVYPRPKLQ
jgi:hypothetical protein